MIVRKGPVFNLAATKPPALWPSRRDKGVAFHNKGIDGLVPKWLVGRSKPTICLRRAPI